MVKNTDGKVEQLREKLYIAIERGEQEEVMRISKEIDVEILKYYGVDR